MKPSKKRIEVNYNPLAVISDYLESFGETYSAAEGVAADQLSGSLP